MLYLCLVAIFPVAAQSVVHHSVFQYFVYCSCILYIFHVFSIFECNFKFLESFLVYSFSSVLPNTLSTAVIWSVRLLFFSENLLPKFSQKIFCLNLIWRYSKIYVRTNNPDHVIWSARQCLAETSYFSLKILLPKLSLKFCLPKFSLKIFCLNLIWRYVCLYFLKHFPLYRLVLFQFYVIQILSSLSLSPPRADQTGSPDFQNQVGWGSW